MEEWIQEQFRFNRTIYLHNNKYELKCAINPGPYKKSLFYFLQDEYDPANEMGRRPGDGMVVGRKRRA